MRDLHLERLSKTYVKIISTLEKGLALVVIISILAYGARSLQYFFTANWGDTSTFYELVFRVLLIVIGLELARMLITHSLNAVLELLAFVIARKMLKPDLDTVDVILGVVSFVALLGARKHFFNTEDRDVPPSFR